ncbi:MAG: hypothetical protein A2350_20800 [Candidatus Raymondbacteria bacterium RifOxyB12_full_50_8]|nr:MAG: hypothetical protein A2350_20800 [Candidatus Raymondbacteria bacterium RifOxyB12_full_50_8]
MRVVISIVVAFVAMALFLLYVKFSKIAYIDSSRVLSEFIEGQKVSKKMSAKRTEYEKNVKALSDTLTHYSDSLQKILQKPINKDKTKAFFMLANKKGQDLERYKTETDKQLKEQESKEMQPIIVKINSFLKEYGEEEGYDIILGASGNGNIVYGKAKLDITTDVINKLNKKYEALK